ncbi:hypothetical protein B9057_05970 [Aestuarium zhoushanense]|nr:hypothetical protein B9057_05970 [Aestuarium zhoushanense]
MVVLGRCHMGGCWWTRVEDIEIIGEGSYAVPGKRIRIKASALNLEARFEDGYDRLIAEATPVHPDWKGPFYLEFFCSMVRPAFLNADDEWEVLSPAIVEGASEGVTNEYLTVCHARDYSGDPYNGGQELGYHVETPGDFETMSFAVLISP